MEFYLKKIPTEPKLLKFIIFFLRIFTAVVEPSGRLRVNFGFYTKK